MNLVFGQRERKEISARTKRAMEEMALEHIHPVSYTHLLHTITSYNNYIKQKKQKKVLTMFVYLISVSYTHL